VQGVVGCCMVRLIDVEMVDVNRGGGGESVNFGIAFEVMLVVV